MMAFVASVVPCTNTSMSGTCSLASSSTSRMPSSTPCSGRVGVVSILRVRRCPSRSSTISVKVPPISTASRIPEFCVGAIVQAICTDVTLLHPRLGCRVAAGRADTKIDLLDLLILFEVGGVALERDAPSLQHIGIVGDAECERDRLFGKQQRQPVAMETV